MSTTTTTKLHDRIVGLLPATPTYNLTVERWIPVIGPDGPDTVGLAGLLDRAHRLDLDDAGHGPLWRHSMERLLIGIGHLIAQAAPGHDWAAVANSGLPLPADGATSVLARLADRLWLHHPTSPFLQRLDVLSHMDDKPDKPIVEVTDPFWALLPDVPSKSNSAWFNRADPDAKTGPADAANALLVRHTWAVPGNETKNGVGKARSEGGSAGQGANDLTHLTIGGPTVAATIARNLIGDWVDRGQRLWFENPAGAVGVLAADDPDPLWLYTATTASTVLIPMFGGYRVVRSPMPEPPEVAKQLGTTLKANNPHTVRFTSVDGKTTPTLRLPVPSCGSDLLRRYHSRLAGGRPLTPSVLDLRGLHVRPARRPMVRALIVIGAGQAAGARVGDVAVAASELADLTLPAPAAVRFAELARIIFGPSPSVRSRTATAISTVRGADGEDDRKQIRASVEHDLTVAADAVVFRLLSACRRNADGDLPDRIPVPDSRLLIDTALGCFDRHVAPLTHRPATAATAVVQRRRLVRHLTRLLSEETP
ncbi:hypothetical protein DVS28_b0133 (plasmid) [Euzebya pacifica]|uniref:Type I-E CRISPR-associated protein Cse1/CasA n=1 Tax=Euzebya pacifica TaxID=1608957 RepID=A0A346Y606_9ACTN|nr:type I-E CRISPR-associated protein Cse1/CasA [Euzebya pacifica]AXV09903.1 hypothetical protein DVS28_b0133 [Euzebya pacifica]